MKSALVAVVLLLVAGQGKEVSGQQVANDTGFAYGVAQGFPNQTHVVIWSRYKPADLVPTPVNFTISRDINFTRPTYTGVLNANASHDWAVKVKLVQLVPNTTYYYKFNVGEEESATGITKTFPEGPTQKLRFITISCAQYDAGWYNLYDLANRIADVDFILFLGDYIYEYGPKQYFSDRLLQYYDPGFPAQRVATLEPPAHIKSIQDFRARFATHRSDKNLQELHRKYPWFMIWDDHEFMDNAYKSGAPEFNATEYNKTWDQFEIDGARVYHEWMPTPIFVAEDFFKISSIFNYGDLARFVFVEDRLLYRDPAPEVGVITTGQEFSQVNRSRTMIGEPGVDLIEQAVNEQLSKGETWQVFGSETVFGTYVTPDMTTFGFNYTDVLAQLPFPELRQWVDGAIPDTPGGKVNVPGQADRWQGFPVERSEVIAILSKPNANPIILSGDSHNSWTFETKDNSGNPVAVEFAGPAITSPGREVVFRLIEQQTQFLDQLPNFLNFWQDFSLEQSVMYGYVDTSPDMVYTQLLNRGIMLHDVTPTTFHTEYLYANTTSEQTYGYFCGVAFEVDAGTVGKVRNVTCQNLDIAGVPLIQGQYPGVYCENSTCVKDEEANSTSRGSGSSSGGFFTRVGTFFGLSG